MNIDYEVLGLSNDATIEEVKKQYKSLVIKWHPDKNNSKEALEIIQEINVAYNNIINKEKQKDIDIHDTQDLNDIFNIFLNEISNIKINNNENININKKGKNVCKILNISLEDIYNGNIYKIQYDNFILNDNKKICSQCEGKGKKIKNEQIGPLSIKLNSICEYCNGVGYIDLYIKKTDTIEFNVPMGLYYNNEFIYKNKGYPILNGENGDLILKLNLLKHNIYKIRGIDLYRTIQISLKESLIGFTREIKHIDNKTIIIKSDEIIYINSTQCIYGRGMFNQNLEYGNLYIKYKIIYPTNFSEEQKRIISEYF